jgi:hypothetical protein
LLIQVVDPEYDELLSMHAPVLYQNPMPYPALQWDISIPFELKPIETKLVLNRLKFWPNRDGILAATTPRLMNEELLPWISTIVQNDQGTVSEKRSSRKRM